MFFHDKGGANAFDDLPNVSARILREDRREKYFSYLFKEFSYDHVSVLSSPKVANYIGELVECGVDYEFHSSDLDVVSREINELDFRFVNSIVVPSQYLADQVGGLLPPIARGRVRVVRNCVDSQIFNTHDSGAPRSIDSRNFGEGIPLVWVGRFDSGKGYAYFLRLLAKLGNEYYGIVVLSLEHDPERAAKFLSEASQLGVSSQVKILLNLQQSQMASLYRSAGEQGGWLISTSFMESFGYSIAEARECGLSVAAFDLPVLKEFGDSGIFAVPSGSVSDLAKVIVTGKK
ncbi:glycosyltransferase [Corynebacterium sp. CCM 9186]|uniref:glycosyltransferase family 4 protein n=1 Tax=Corynebacterium meridianum TaxID=2765363 RepID=UPI0020047DF2|nr:glycosyltransferase [Corynebacterium meridianum]